VPYCQNIKETQLIKKFINISNKIEIFFQKE
jgi:hypothetical protein